MNMKISVGLFLLSGALWISAPSHAADGQDASPSLTDPKEILEIGRKGDKSKIAQLRKLKAGKDKSLRGAAANAQMALARMGEKREMDEILAEAKDDDPEVKLNSVKKLGYVRNKAAVQALALQLDDTKLKRKSFKDKDGKSRVGHVIFGAPAFEAIKELSDIAPDGPKIDKDNPTEDDVKRWKEWWKTNKQKYQ